MPRPLNSVRKYCLRCCTGSASEVRLCVSMSCPAWGYRHGKKPTADVVAEIGDRLMYPLEDGTTVAAFHKHGGTVLKAIKRLCLDCSGGSKSEVKNCRRHTCDLHPFRLGKNPNRAMSPEQRKIAAARLKANIPSKRKGNVV